MIEFLKTIWSYWGIVIDKGFDLILLAIVVILAAIWVIKKDREAKKRDAKTWKDRKGR